MLGFVQGMSFKNENFNQQLIITKDKRVQKGQIIISLDRYLVIKNDVFELVLIKTDDINYINGGTINSKFLKK